MRSLTPEQRLDRLADLFSQHDRTGWEIAEHCWHLVKVDSLSQREVAVRAGRSVTTISRYLRTWEYREAVPAPEHQDWTFGDWQTAAEHGEGAVIVAEEREVSPTRAWIDHKSAVKDAKRQLAGGIPEDKVREAARIADQRTTKTDAEKAIESKQRADVHDATSSVRRQVANLRSIGLLSQFRQLAEDIHVAVENDADLGADDIAQMRRYLRSIDEDLQVYEARASLDEEVSA